MARGKSSGKAATALKKTVMLFIKREKKLNTTKLAEWYRNYSALRNYTDKWLFSRRNLYYILNKLEQEHKIKWERRICRYPGVITWQR